MFVKNPQRSSQESPIHNSGVSSAVYESQPEMSSARARITLPSAKALISAAATTAMFVRLVAVEYLPTELRRYAAAKLTELLSTFSRQTTLLIAEYDGLNKNRLYSAAELYFGAIAAPSPSAGSYRASLLNKETKIDVSFRGPKDITDKFQGIHVKWRLIVKAINTRYVNSGDDYESTSSIYEAKYLQLTFHKKHKKRVIDEYLPYVLERSVAVRENRKPLKLFTLKHEGVHSRTSPWQSVNLDHPAKFETLAMDDEKKKMIVGDLDVFLKRKELYRRVGKAWKRGYLLFGPPGTGKSSLIAAMANYLNFDVYDLELSQVGSDSQLRKLLISTANRSILVAEDIDASVDLTGGRIPHQHHHQHQHQQQGTKVTLSGLLNFIDGLWSSIGDERIIIFTTNHKERLDPALLRPGRMDVHIHMSYCTPCGFKLLVENYLGISEHPSVSMAEEMIASCNVTPAEVGEQLLKSEDPGVALNGLIKFLEEKMEEEKMEEERDEREQAQAQAQARGAMISREEAYDEREQAQAYAAYAGMDVSREQAAQALWLLCAFFQPQESRNREAYDAGHSG